MKSAIKAGEIIFVDKESEADKAWRSASPETTVVLRGKIIGTTAQSDESTDEKLRTMHAQQRHVQY